MKFEYDPNKSNSNKVKHGIDFEEAQALWDDRDAIMFAVDRVGEPRFIVIGKIQERHWTAVITFRQENTRIISVRRSRTTEKKLYERSEHEHNN